jgi:hypothetical protein
MKPPPEQVYVIFNRALAGDTLARADALDIALRGWSIWMRSGGTIDLGRCMGIPTTASGRRWAKMLRDFHLAKAFNLIAGPSIPKRCATLAAAVRRFMTDIWPHWRHLEIPPFGAGEMNRHLFQAARALPERMSLSTKQIQRVVQTILGQEMSQQASHDGGVATEEIIMDDIDLGLTEGLHYRQGRLYDASLAVLILNCWRANPALRARFADSIGQFEAHVRHQAESLAGLIAEEA